MRLNAMDAWKATGMNKAKADPGMGAEKIRQRNMNKIMRAATRLFARKGFEGTRTTEIAAASGLPKANIYYYFPSKEHVYLAIIQHLLHGWTDTLQHIRPDRDPMEALEAYVRAKLEYSWRNADESRLFANEILGGGRFLTAKDRRYMREITERYSKVIEGWIAQGKIRNVNSRHLLISFWATTQYYADFEMLAADALELRSLRRADYEEAARTVIDTILRGLRPD